MGLQDKHGMGVEATRSNQLHLTTENSQEMNLIGQDGFPATPAVTAHEDQKVHRSTPLVPGSPEALHSLSRETDQLTEVVLESKMFLEDAGQVTVTLRKDVISWSPVTADDQDEVHVPCNCGQGQKILACFKKFVPDPTSRPHSSAGSAILEDVYGVEGPGQGALTPTKLGVGLEHFLINPIQLHTFVVHTFTRSEDLGQWIPKALTFGHQNRDTCQLWVNRIKEFLDADKNRPKKLLVFVNPFGGRRQGSERWKLVEPIFQRAGVQTEVIITDRQNHAAEMIDKASDKELLSRDGIVVVGGDGLFNEVINGLAKSRHNAPEAPMPSRGRTLQPATSSSSLGETWSLDAPLPVALKTNSRAVELVKALNLGRNTDNPRVLEELNIPLMLNPLPSPNLSPIPSPRPQASPSLNPRVSSNPDRDPSRDPDHDLGHNFLNANANPDSSPNPTSNPNPNPNPNPISTSQDLHPDLNAALGTPDQQTLGSTRSLSASTGGSGQALSAEADEKVFTERLPGQVSSGQDFGSPETAGPSFGCQEGSFLEPSREDKKGDDVAPANEGKKIEKNEASSNGAKTGGITAAIFGLGLSLFGTARVQNDRGTNQSGRIHPKGEVSLADTASNTEEDKPVPSLSTKDEDSLASIRDEPHHHGLTKDEQLSASSRDKKCDSMATKDEKPAASRKDEIHCTACRNDEDCEPGGNDSCNGSCKGQKDETEQRSTPADGHKRQKLGSVLVPDAGLRVDKKSLRIGIIPAGSTDTIVVSTNGTRDPITAALHIVLGDRMPLDIVRFTSWPSAQKKTNEQKKTSRGEDKDDATEETQEAPNVRYAASFCGYGFYGDVARESENFRWMGPARYDYAGFLTYFRHKRYDAEVAYLEMPPPPENSETDTRPHGPWPGGAAMGRNHQQRRKGGQGTCRMHCQVCAAGQDLSHLAELASRDEEEPEASRGSPSHGPSWRGEREEGQQREVMEGRGGEGGEKREGDVGHMKGSFQEGRGPRWKKVRGNFHSVGAAVMSCRNDKAPDGVAAQAHLADGQLHLILHRECSRPEYLWQLLRVTWKGADPLDFDFVEWHKTPAFTFVSHGRESTWNVDGELFSAHQLSAQVFRGLVDVFARGPET